MPTRTLLTTPPGQTPSDRPGTGSDGETYVPGPDLPHEPRVPGRHRRTLAVLTVVLVAVVVVATLVLVGEQAQREDPAVPDDPGTEEPDAEDPDMLELPES